MNFLTRLIIIFLSLFIPKFRKDKRNEVIEVERYVRIERNSICYCGSRKKYKNCHLITNSVEEKEAIIKVNKDGSRAIEVIDKEVIDQLKGIKFEKIQVKNTFSSVQVGLGSRSSG